MKHEEEKHEEEKHEEEKQEEEKQEEEKQEEEKHEEKGKLFADGGLIVMGLVGLWVLLGIIAFVKSILCFSSSSTLTEKIIGLILAVLFGPFYFLYFYLNPTYCKSKKSTNNNRRNATNNNRRNATNNRRN